MTVDFNGGGIDKIKQELIKRDCALASIANVAIHGLIFVGTNRLKLTRQP